MVTHSLLRRAASGAVLAAGLAASLPALPARAAGREDGVAPWLESMGEFFELHPDYKIRRGHGWKPYNRLKWFYEQRMVDGEEPPVGARWRAWEAKRELEQQVSPRVSWFSLGPANLAGRMLALEFDPTDPNILYAGAAGGGLWKSTDGGQSWSALTDELATLAVGGVAVLPSNPKVVVIGTGEGTINVDRIGGVGILRSTDGGKNWSTTSLTYAESLGHGFHFVEANPVSGTFLAGATDSLWRSTDGGVTWASVGIGGDFYDAKWKPGDASTVFAAKGSASGGGNNVKISTDDGLTWTKAGTGQPLSSLVGKTKIAMSSADPNTIYAMYANKSTGELLGVYRSTDGGSNWSLRATSPNIPVGQGWYNLSLAVDPDDANHVIAGGVSLYHSTDGGIVFNLTGNGVVHVDHHDVTYRPGSTSTLFVATDGGVWESTDDGTSWIDRNAGLVTYQFYDICVNNHSADPNFLMGGTQDQGTDRWTGTTTWGDGLGGDGMVCNINPLNGRTVYAEQQFGNHRKNTNAGSGSWPFIMTGITGGGAWVTPVDEDQNLGNHLYTATDQGIFRTTQGGNPWVNVAAHTATWISISPVDGNVVWTAGGTVKYTTDDGVTWKTAASFPFPVGGVTKILAHPTDVASAFVTFSGYSASVAHIARTTNLGVSWQDVTGDFPSQPVNAIAVDPMDTSLWFIGTDVGVWVSTNGGNHWLPFETGLPNSVVCDLEIQIATHKLFAGTHGRGAWEVDISGLTNLDPEDPEIDVARPRSSLRLLLDPPRPNPARGETTLRFAAWHEEEVILAIHDVRGRLVSEVSRLPAGDGIVRWTTWRTSDFPSGVYFAVLRAGEDRVSRKLVVAK